ncbi:MAG: AMP-binding protein [Synergistaceae bacterium]|jgi:acyl-CoA synthetase (AMP-forming)/AMP-acid ligase II|nr:AMP-binding protein [Synergistaceae bacterium]
MTGEFYGGIGEIVALRLREDPGRIFISEPETGRTLTFGELARSVSDTAGALSQKGFRKRDMVALSFHNSIEAAIAFLGVVSAGGIALPLNPNGVKREMEFPLDDSGARFLLSASSAPIKADMFSDFKSSEIGNGLTLHTLPPAERERREEIPEDMALLLYTSGTTGLPKGVVLTHRNLTCECRNIAGAHALSKDDRALCLLPVHHINGLVVTLLTPLYAGCEVVMPPKFSAGSFWKWVQLGVTWFSAVPTIFSILLSRTSETEAAGSNLRFARSASAPLPEATLSEFENRFGVPVIESYGISEGCSQITSNPLPPAPHKPGSAGIPFGNEVKIFNGDGSEAAEGTIGEVAVKGENISPGYFRNPDATTKSFRGAWFFTGDLGRFDKDGYLFLHGRKKELINRAGEMISPREIDEIMYSFPGVESAASVGVPHAFYGEEVIAFVRPREGVSIHEDEIRKFCADKLADFKIPKRIYSVDDFPKGPSGKIQRRKLAEIYMALPESEKLP